MKGYATRDVAKLLGLSPSQVRAFARGGFLAPDRGPGGELRFSFPDLVLLRAAQGLAAARIPARRIRRALRELKAQLPAGRLIRQGDAVGRPSRLRLRVDEERRIFVSGEVVELGVGTVRLS